MSDIVEDALNKANELDAKNVSTNDNPVVWVSNTYNYSSQGMAPSKVNLTLDQMQNKVKSWFASRDPQYTAYANKLITGGFMNESYRDQGEVASRALATAVGIYQAYAADGGQLSFDDWFDWFSSTSEQADAGAGGGRGGGYAGPVTTVSTTITDPVTAESVLDNFARDLLGRSLTKRETEKYLQQYRQIEEDSPQVTTTRPMGQARRETITESAPSKEEMLRQVMAQNPDYQKYQIDTTIMDLLLDDIKAGQEVIRG